MKKWLKVLSLVIVAAFPLTKIQGQGANEVVRLDPALDEIISADAKVEKLAGDFGWTEGAGLGAPRKRIPSVQRHTC